MEGGAKAKQTTVKRNSLSEKSEVYLVTGGSGFVGQHVIKQLQERGNNIKEIRVFDTKPYYKQLEFKDTKKLTYIHGDLRHSDEVHDAVQGVDCVIHTAGVISFGTSPDCELMEEVNVKGTKTLLQACLDANVERFVYTSSVDVSIGYEEIHNGDEDLPVPATFLFPGYPDTKHRAEKLVLETHDKATSNGTLMSTVSLRPNVMYGELDPYYITNGLQRARQNKGILVRVGDGSALFQQAYAGNVAWAHVAAAAALKRNRECGGKAYFITDDTPLMNTFDFTNIFLELRGYSLSTYTIPYPLIYVVMYCFECLLWMVKPLKEFNFATALCSIIYVNKTIYFNSQRARDELGYKPVYDFQQSSKLSSKYYKDVQI